MENERFLLEYSKFKTLDKFKSSQRDKITKSVGKVPSRDLLSVKSDATGVHIPDQLKDNFSKTESEAVFKSEEKSGYEEDDILHVHSKPLDSLSPFNLLRVYGRSDKVPIINLTGLYRNHIAYASSNVLVIYDYVQNVQKCLQGHRNDITSLVMGPKFRLLVSCDSGKQNLIILWDIISGKPVKYFRNTHADVGCINVSFVGFEVYIASLGAESVSKQTISFWDYDTRNKTQTPILTAKLPSATSILRDMAFLQSKPDFFVITGDRTIIFGTWIRKHRENSSIHWHKPKLRKNFIDKHKRFVSSLWIHNGASVATATGTGHVLLWSPPAALALEEPPDPNKNIKEYYRSFKLCEDEITVFKSFREFLVVGDDLGIVRFFDQSFKILRWCKTGTAAEIRSISFNQCEIPDFKYEYREKYDPNNPNRVKRYGESRVKDYTAGGEKFHQASETTVSRPPFPIPDFVLGFKGGDAYYYHFSEMQQDKLVSGTPGTFISCDVCPRSNHILLTTCKGEIQMYSFNTYELVFSGKIFTNMNKINVVKFHPIGRIIVFGLTDGHLCFRWNFNWKTAIQPLFETEGCIKKIIFTEDGVNMAYYDSNHAVVCFRYLPKTNSWMLVGKVQAHFEPIQDIKFFIDPKAGKDRLFTIGLDRHLVEYDIHKITDDQELQIVKVLSVEQTARPSAMVINGPLEFGHDCITFSNDINKLRIFSYEEEKVKKTCSGPVLGREKGISRLVEFPVQMSTKRFKKFIIYTVHNRLGFIDTPIDGNLHKYMSVQTHPKEIHELIVVADRLRIFTLGKDDNSCFVWEASPRAVEATVLMGGSGLTPFYHALSRHWGNSYLDILKDLDMIFFYLNLKRIDRQQEMYVMSRAIKLSEIAAVCRACGYYPSEYEIGLIMDEARRLKEATHNYSNDLDTKITFDEFIKLFVNHYYRTTDEDVEEAFKVLGFSDFDEDGAQRHYICRRDFITYLTTEGEKISEHNFPIYFEPMYDYHFDGEFGEVLCHIKGASTATSTVSSSSSTGSIEAQEAAEESTSSSSSLGEFDEKQGQDESPSTNLQSESDNVQRDQDADDDFDNEKDGDIDIDDGNVVLVTEEFEGENVEEEEEQEQQQQHPKKRSTKTNRISLGEKQFQDISDFGHDEDLELVDDEDDVVDLPERIDLEYFLDTMLPHESQETIKWKSKIDKLTRLVRAKIQMEPQLDQPIDLNKEVLNTLRHKTIDPSYPIPKNILNALYTEFIAQHADFSVQPDVCINVELPEGTWYEEEGEEEEEQVEAEIEATEIITDEMMEKEPSAKDKERSDKPPKGDDISDQGVIGSTLAEVEEFDETLGELGEEENEQQSTEPMMSTLIKNFEETGYESQPEFEPTTVDLSVSKRENSPPFSMSERQDTVTERKVDDTDMTEMTDVENIYDQEEYEYVKEVNASFAAEE